jgi:hypothetical protein
MHKVADTGCMITLISIAAPFMVMGAIDVLAHKFGRDSRPVFDGRRIV